MSEEIQPEIVKPTLPIRRFIIYAVVLLVVFLLGFIPMWLKARECARGLAESETCSRIPGGRAFVPFSAAALPSSLRALSKR